MAEEKKDVTSPELYFEKYNIRDDKQIRTTDIYVLLNYTKGKENLIDKVKDVLKKHIPAVDFKEVALKDFRKEYVQNLIAPFEQADTKEVQAFKADLISLHKELKALHKEEIKKIKEYYKNNDIDLTQPLHHNDIYNYINKVKDGVNKLSVILNKELPAVLHKDYVIKEIVKPINDAGMASKVKNALVADMKNNLANKVEQKAQNKFKNWEFIDNGKIWDKDIFAFLSQSNKEGKELFNKKLMELTGKALPAGKMTMDFLIKEIVKPIKNMGEAVEQDFKKAMIVILQQYAIDEEQQQSQEKAKSQKR